MKLIIEIQKGHAYGRACRALEGEHIKVGDVVVVEEDRVDELFVQWENIALNAWSIPPVLVHLDQTSMSLASLLLSQERRLSAPYRPYYSHHCYL
jgi:hypothetical protein